MNHFGFEHWLFTFCIYCILGWMQESLIESAYHKRPVNRGFLRGPYIPIYGVGGLLLLFICEPFKDNAFVVFAVALVSCTTLEFFTGWLMERLFGKQFWDYSMLKLVYKNRISLLTSLFWGVMGLFVTYVVSDATVYVLNHLSHNMICIAAVLISLIMTIDFVNTVRRQLDRKRFPKVFSVIGSGHYGAIRSRIKSIFAYDETDSDSEDNDNE